MCLIAQQNYTINTVNHSLMYAIVLPIILGCLVI